MSAPRESRSFNWYGLAMVFATGALALGGLADIAVLAAKILARVLP